MFFNTEAGTIKSLFSGEDSYNVSGKNLSAFACTWYLFTCITYGVWVPAGLFLPGIIVGGSMGRLYTMFTQYVQGYTNTDELQQNAMLGAAAMLSGYCRLTYSLAVLMLETT